jgi:UDP-N-acetylglucosamine 2-epimerase (non-hydrolysing)
VDDKDSLGEIIVNLEKLAHRLPVVFPMHPRTRKMLAQFGIMPASNGMFKVLEPIGYYDSICLTQNARLILTDSGGLQEESTFFKTPCLTLRPNTERPVTITLGSNRLTQLSRLSADIEEILSAGKEKGRIPPLWDGNASARIIEALIEQDQIIRQRHLS